MTSTLTKSQKQKHIKAYTENGERYRIKCEIRYDDDCNNGHNTFAITGEIERKAGNGRWIEDCCGCIHEDIEKRFPEFAHLIKWHLCSSDGPMHYTANTMYHASPKDCNGKLAGEPTSFDRVILFSSVPIKHRVDRKFWDWLQTPDAKFNNYDCEVIAIPHGKTDGYQFAPKYTLGGYPAEKWHECPFDTEEEALDFLSALQNCSPEFGKMATSFSEGKEPDLNAARHCAIWPDATLEQLQDKETLDARLSALLENFRADMESTGFTF